MSRVLMISPTPTHPAGAGNRARVQTMLQTLIAEGHEVTFLHIEQEEGDRAAMTKAWGERYKHVAYDFPRKLSARIRARVSRLLRPSGIHNFQVDDWWDERVEPTIRELASQGQFDAVIVAYVFMSKALELFDGSVRKIIDTHDMFTNRHQRYIDEGQAPQWFSTTASEEGRAFARADRVIAISDKERDEFKRMTETPVVTIGHFVETRPKPAAIAERGAMLFVASDNPINLHGIRWFIDQALPLIRRKHPRAEVWVVGSAAAKLDEQPGVRLLGRVESLAEVYADTHIVINPVRFSTGLSIKNLEALAYSCALVTAPTGADGLGTGHDDAFLVADEAEAWCETIHRIFEDDKLAATLSARAAETAQRWNQAATKRLNDAIR